MSEIATTPEQPVESLDDQQEPKTFDADYVANLRKEAAKYRTEARANADAARKLQELEEANLSEVEKAKQAATAAEARLREYEMTTLRQAVAIDKRLPAELVDRLRGDTREDLERDADALLALVNAPRGMQPDFSQGAQSAAPSTPEQEFLAFTTKH